MSNDQTLLSRKEGDCSFLAASKADDAMALCKQAIALCMSPT